MEKETIIIREATEKDLEELVKLYRYTWQKIYSDFVRPGQMPTLAPATRRKKFLAKMQEKKTIFWWRRSIALWWGWSA